LLAAAAVARAEPVPIGNASFEADPVATNSFAALTPQSWSLYDPNEIVDRSLDAIGVLNPTSSTFFPGGAPDGDNVALVFLSGDTGGGHVGLVQTLDATLAAHTAYALAVDVGNIASGIAAPPFDQFYDLDGFPGYAVQLLAGDVVVAEDANGLAPSLAEGTFATSVVELTTGADPAQLGAPLAIRLVNLNTPGTEEAPGIEVDFDDVRLDATAVPEPSRAALAAAALIALATKLARR
jgi:hypothetical protein